MTDTEDRDYHETECRSPLRARRRKSDAKWRASVATCYDALRYVVPDTPTLARKKISKALILEESEKHIRDLESTIDDLLNVKCPAMGKTLMWKDAHCWTPCTVDTLRDDFANQQHKIFHRSLQSRRCYSLFRDIQEDIFNMATDPANVCLVDEVLSPSTGRDVRRRPAPGSQISVLPSMASMLGANADDGHGEGRQRAVGDDDDDHHDHKDYDDDDDDDIDSLPVWDFLRDHVGFGFESPKLSGVKEIAASQALLSTPGNDLSSLTKANGQPSSQAKVERSSHSHQKGKNANRLFLLDAAHPSSSSSTLSSASSSSSSSSLPSSSSSSSSSRAALRPPARSMDSCLHENQQLSKKVPSLTTPSSSGKKATPLSFWANQPEDGKGMRDVPVTEVRAVKVESVSPVIHVPLLDDLDFDSSPTGSRSGVDTNDKIAGAKGARAASVEDLAAFGDVLASDSDVIWGSDEAAGGDERTPAVPDPGQMVEVVTDGLKRKVFYGNHPKATPPKGQGRGTDTSSDDCQVVPQAGNSNESDVTAVGHKVELVDFDSLMPSDLMFCPEAQADFDGFSYYYRQVSQRLTKNSRLSTTEIAAKAAHLWTRLSDTAKQTVRMLASIEKQTWTDQSSGSDPHGGSNLSQDLQDVDVMPLEIHDDWSDSAF